MELLLAVLVGIPLGWHLAIVAGTYWDAGRVGMSQPKWAAVAFLVPLFGFFAYLFERTELTRDEDGDGPYAEGPYEVHESVADGDRGSVADGEVEGVLATEYDWEDDP
jgi:hypothetical protein